MLVEQIIEDILLSTPILKIGDISVIDPSKNIYKITTCNTYWVHPCFKLEVDGVVARVLEEEFVHNKEFVIRAESAINVNIKELPLPKILFVSGTAQMASLRIDKTDLMPSPFVYLSKEYAREKGGRFSRNHEVARRVQIYACADWDTRANPYWEQKQHNAFIIKPLNSVIDYLYNRIAKHKSVNRAEFLQESRPLITDKTLWGDIKERKGNQKTSFNRNLDAVELQIDIPIKKELNCKCK